MRLKTVVIGATLLLLLGACRKHETVDGSYGNGVVSAQVVMAPEMANQSPAGVQVTLEGTGMTTVLGTDGHFLFSGVPDSATLRFNRADVANVKMNIAGSATGPIVIELSSSSAHSGGHHRAAPSVPASQFEGTIVTVSATSITIADSHKNNVTLAITDKTGIRQGNTTLQATDLKVGEQVHAKGITISGTLTATEIVVQQPDDSGDSTMTAEGTVKSVGTTSLTVTTEKGDVTVNVDANTVIRKQGTTIQLSDIKVGDRVDAVGTKVDDHTLLAKQIEVAGAAQGGEVTTANGTVKSVGATSLVVTSEDHGDVTVNVDANTIIRKQGTTIQLSDIKVGDQVNTLGTKVDDHTLLAKQIEVRGVGQGAVMTANGTVKSVGASSLVVTGDHGGDVTVNVDSSTIIRKQGSVISLSDIKVGDEVNALGTRVDAQTLNAKQIEVDGSEAGHHS